MQAPSFESVPNAGGDGLPEVPVDELDFDFVRKCEDHNKLRDILTILESGKEGHYPELIQLTIDRLLECMPAKEKKLFLALRTPPSATEEDAARNDLSDWIGQISQTDAAVAKAASSREGPAPSGEIFAEETESAGYIYAGRSTKVPVRNQGHAGAESGDSGVRQQLGSSKASLHGAEAEAEPKWTAAKPDPKARDFKSYYNDWDKFDPDAELDKMDEADQEAERQRRERQLQQQQRLQAEAEARKVRMTELGISLDPTMMTEEEIQFTSEREKRKGNECFKANEFEDAILYYSRSIFVNPANAVVWANRAMAHLRLKQFDKAEADCTESIRLDPTYVKAISRRAMTRHKRGKYREAAKDYHAAVQMDPSNKTLRTLLQESRKKFTEVEGLALDAEQNPVKPEKFKRITIIAEDDSSDDDDGDDSDSDSDSDDNDMPSLTAAPETKPVPAQSDSAAPEPENQDPSAASSQSSGFRKIMVQEGSDSDSSDEEEETADDGADTRQVTASSTDDRKATADQAAQPSNSRSRNEQIIQDTLVTSSDDAAAVVAKIRERGNKFFAAGDLTLAVATYDQAIALQPSPPAPALAACYGNRAAAQIKLKAFMFAERDATSALQLVEKLADTKSVVLRLKVLYRRAVARKAQGKLAGAVEDLRSVLTLQPTNAQAVALLKETEAEITKRNEQQASAAAARREEELERQRQRQAEDERKLKEELQRKEQQKAQEQDTPLAHRERMAAASAAGIEATSAKTPELPNSVQAAQLKDEGNAAFKAKNYDGAIELYTQAIGLDPSNAVYYLNRAAALLVIESEASWRRCIHDTSRALDLVAEVLAVDDSSAKARASRSKALFRRASAKEKLMALLWSRKDSEGALSNARSAIEDATLALEFEPSHKHLLALKERVSQRVAAFETTLSQLSSPSAAAGLSAHAASKLEKEAKAAKLAERAQALRQATVDDSPSKGFKAPRTAYAVLQTLASFKGADATKRQTAYLWQFKTGSWTAKKLFAKGVDVEILGPLVRCLEAKFSTAPKRCISILQKIRACKNADTAAMLLSSEDSDSLKQLQQRAVAFDPSAKVEF